MNQINFKNNQKSREAYFIILFSIKRALKSISFSFLLPQFHSGCPFFKINWDFSIRHIYKINTGK